jgi:hypothetical protein
MRRRAFLGVLGCAAAWPIALKAQPADRVRVVGILSILALDDPEGKERITIFKQTLQQLGWAVGRDLKIETREVGGDVDRTRRYRRRAGRPRAGRHLLHRHHTDYIAATGDSQHTHRVYERS